MSHRADGLNDIFEHDVTIREKLWTKELELTKPVWEDLQINLSSARLPAASAPTWRVHDFGVAGGLDYSVLGFGIGDYIDIYAQTTHSMKINSLLDLHLHGTLPSDDAGKKVAWEFTVIGAGIGSDWVAKTGSPFTAEMTLDGTQAGKHNLFEVANIEAGNSTVSSVFIGRLKRIAASSDDYPNEVYLVYADCHYQKNTMGSRTESSK